MPGGRPSKYKKEFCERLIKHMEDGLSFEAFAGEIGVAIDTVYNWNKKHPEFSEAKKIGTAKSQLFWEKMGRSGVVGKIPGFNTAAWIFNMKNRFNWRDKREFSGDKDNPVSFAGLVASFDEDVKDYEDGEE